MIINESVNRKEKSVTFDITDPKKFIARIGGITDNHVNEYQSDKDAIRAQYAAMLKANRMSNPPKPTEIKRSGNKIKIPWSIAGALLSDLNSWGLKRNKGE